MSCSKITGCDQEWPAWAKKAAKEYFPSWNRYLFHPKRFSYSSDHGLIRTYVGFILFDLPKNINATSEVDLSEVWLKYSEKERNVLERIVCQFKFNEKHKAVLNHTYLYLEDHTIQCVFRQLLPDGKVNFIDVYGRVYKSWRHFCETNVLRSCQYLAPKDGIHKVDQKLEVFKSPGNALPACMKHIATGCTFVAIGLAATGVGLGIAAVCGGIGTVYGVGNYGFTLIDRYEHEQSIRLDNAESVVCWLTLTTAALNGVSWLAVKNASKMVNLTGRSAKYTLMAPSIAGLGSSLANCSVHLYYLHRKRISGEELTLADALGVCVNVMLTCGAVYTTREMYNFINTVDVQPVSLLSASNELPVNTCTDVQEIVDVSQQIIPQGNFNFVLNISEELILKNFNERTRKVYYQCVTIGKTCEEFKKNKMDSESFCRYLVTHCMNLQAAMSESVAEVRARVNSCLGNAPIEVTDQVSRSVASATESVQKVDIPAIARPRTRDHIIHTFFQPKYMIIIHLAKNRIPQTVPPIEILSSFSDQIESLINEIASKVDSNYRQFVSRHENLLGKPRADELFSKLGINSKGDFADQNFFKLVEELEKQIQPVVHSVEMERITEKLCTMYEEIFQKDADFGALETCEVLKKSLRQLLHPLRKTFESCVELYDFNFSLLGQKKALALTVMSVESADKRSNESDEVSQPPLSVFFDVACEKLDFNEIIGTIWQIANSKEQDEVPPTNTLSDEIIQSTLLSLCKDFFQKVKSNDSITITDAEYDERLKHIYDYFTKYFVSSYQELSEEKNSNLQQLMELNESYFDEHRTLVSKFKAVCASNNYEIFKSVEKRFRDKKNLRNLAKKYVSEYKLIDDVCTEVCKNKIVGMYSINEGNLSKVQDYKRRAAKMFNLIENEIQSVKMDKEIVALRCNHLYITFQMKGAKSMYVMAIDTSKLPTSE